MQRIVVAEFLERSDSDDIQRVAFPVQSWNYLLVRWWTSIWTWSQRYFSQVLHHRMGVESLRDFLWTYVSLNHQLQYWPAHVCFAGFRELLPRDAMLARYVLSSCVCLSVCLSVRQSVTRRYCTKTAKHTSWKQRHMIAQGVTLPGGPKSDTSRTM